MSGRRMVKPRLYLTFSAVLVLTPFLYMLAAHNYLIFHSLIEGVSVALSFAIFIIGEQIYTATKKQIFLALSIGYFFVALIDLLHLCTYYGMRLLPISDPSIPTQLWVGARFLEAFSLSLAPTFFTKNYREGLAYFLYGAAVASLIVTIFVVPIFPECYLPGEGLTAFKIGSEYLIIVLLAIGIFRFSQIYPINARSPFSLVSASMSVIIVAEIFFTSYADVYGFTNFTGHILTVTARYLMYYAIASATTMNLTNSFR